MLDYLFKRLLIISPHGDDEVLGCGGLIAKVIHEVSNASINILLFGTGDIYNESGVIVSSNERVNEFNSMIHYYQSLNYNINIKGRVLFANMELNLENVGMSKAVTVLDSCINEYDPTAVLVCYASHHQDHQFVCNATMAALRPTSSDKVLFKGMYEYGYHEAWNPMNQVKMSKFYVDISNYIDNKIDAFKCYKSQQKENSRDILSISCIKKYAQSRGLECGSDYAEVLFPLTIKV